MAAETDRHNEAADSSRLEPSSWFTLPAVIYLLVTTQIPLLATLYFSLHSWNLLYPARPVRFVGIQNFVSLAMDDNFRLAGLNTILFTLVPVAGTLCVGLGFALLVNALTFGRGLAYVLLFTPFLIMETVTPIIWKNMILNPIYGLLNYWLSLVGLPAVDLISNAPRLAVIVMIVWQWSPFMMLVILAGLQSVGKDVKEAARIDGAGAFDEFLHITLPHLVPYFAVGMLIEAILILPVFGPIYVATYGGPGNQSTNLMFAVFRVLTEQYEIGKAAAGGLIVAVLTSIVAMALLPYLRPYLERQ